MPDPKENKGNVQPGQQAPAEAGQALYGLMDQIDSVLSKPAPKINDQELLVNDSNVIWNDFTARKQAA